jgi:hypothetical protein
MKNAADRNWFGSGTVGFAVKWRTWATNVAPLAIGRAGVMTMSSPTRENAAGRPFTTTLPTPAPLKSRSNRDSACVARATIVTVPSMPWDGALVAYRRARS